MSLLSYQFRAFPAVLALSIMEAANAGRSANSSVYTPKPFTRIDLLSHFTAYDLKRLDSYSNNLLDYHVILDLLPQLAELYFHGRLGADVRLSGVQSSILLALGLQRKNIDDIERELTLPSSQLLALFIKIVRRMSTYFKALETKALETTVPGGLTNRKGTKNGMKTATKEEEEPGEGEEDDDEDEAEEGEEDEDEDEDGRNGNAQKRDIMDEEAWDPIKQALDDDLDEAGDEVMKGLKEKQRELINSLDLSK